MGPDSPLSSTWILCFGTLDVDRMQRIDAIVAESLAHEVLCGLDRVRQRGTSAQKPVVETPFEILTDEVR